MSYLSKSSDFEENSIIWPGFVDVLASTLMVIIFIVMLFTVSQVYLGDLVIGKNEEIQNLEKTIDIQDNTIVYQDETLTDKELDLINKDEIIVNKEKIIVNKEEIIVNKEEIIVNKDLSILDLSEVVGRQNLDIDALNAIISQITNELSMNLEENISMQNDIKILQNEQTSLIESLLSSSNDKSILKNQVTDLNFQNESLKNDLTNMNVEAAIRNDEIKIALTKISNLSNNVELLTNEILNLNKVLGVKEIEIAQSKLDLGELGDRLNRVLTSELFKLQKYRSEFFGKLSELLGDREEIKVQGDRFVFQSEVLFSSGSANIEDDGRAALSSISKILLELIDELPTDIDWILQIDGHTDKVPIYTEEFPSNWELSNSRALKVLKFLISQGVPSERLSANGYGDNQPITLGDTPKELKLNRRIELKITQR